MLFLHHIILFIYLDDNNKKQPVLRAFYPE